VRSQVDRSSGRVDFASPQPSTVRPTALSHHSLLRPPPSFLQYAVKPRSPDHRRPRSGDLGPGALALRHLVRQPAFPRIGPSCHARSEHLSFCHRASLTLLATFARHSDAEWNLYLLGGTNDVNLGQASSFSCESTSARKLPLLLAGDTTQLTADRELCPLSSLGPDSDSLWQAVRLSSPASCVLIVTDCRLTAIVSSGRSDQAIHRLEPDVPPEPV
jgi:hypothetical protein